MRRSRAGFISKTLAALAAGLVVLVLAVAPLHSHPAGANDPGACRLCEVSHRPLDLPTAGASLDSDPGAAACAPDAGTPFVLPRADVLPGQPSLPRAPPLHS